MISSDSCLFFFVLCVCIYSGNGWIDPIVQGPATIDYSWWHGLIDGPTRENLFKEWEDCLVNYLDTIIDEKESKVEFQVSFTIQMLCYVV